MIVNAWNLEPSPIRPVRKDRLFRRIADQLSELIACGEFQVGQCLPAERDLARQLGVSRPTVREALTMLEVEGKIEARGGAGAFVLSAQPFEPHAPLGGDHELLEVLRARRIVEGEAAATAARKRTALDLLAIRYALDAMDDVPRNGRFGESLDRKFHLVVAAATHNRAVMAVVRALCAPCRDRLGGRSVARRWTPTLHGASLLDYRAIVDAIEAGEPRPARAAMRRHLDRNIWVATNRAPDGYERRALSASVRRV